MSRIAFISLLLLGVVACGFHLRGAATMPAELVPMYLDVSDDDELLNELSALLKANGVALAESESAAASHLLIGKQNTSRRVLSVDSSGRAREYELNYSVLYTLKSKHMDTENVVRLQRELLFDPDNVLGAGYEEQTLYRDMRRDAARLILQQLEAMHPISLPAQELTDR